MADDQSPSPSASQELTRKGDGKSFGAKKIVPVGGGKFTAPHPMVQVPVSRGSAMASVMKGTPVGELMDNLARFTDDFAGFVRWAFPWGEAGSPLADQAGPEQWQFEQQERISARIRAGGPEGCVIEEDVSSGHGVGKSAQVSWAILWAISTHADTRGIVTAQTDTQLRTKTWAELAKWYAMFIGRQLFTLTATAIYIAADPVREKSWRIDQIPWSKNNTEAFAGLHNQGRRLLVIFDEASAIDDAIWDVTKGALTDARTQILWLRYGNPTRTSGSFFRNCIQQGALVLTERGWTPIQDVGGGVRVWDGIEWVTQKGAYFSGVRETIKAFGVGMTLDHLVLTTKGWVHAQGCEGLERADCRLPDCYEVRRLPPEGGGRTGPEPVYDLIDCGPRNRFVVQGSDGLPLIVHNCTSGKRNTYTRVDSRTVSFSNKVEIAAWIEDEGEDSDFVRVRVKGQFPRAGFSNFISPELVMEARRRRLGLTSYSSFPKILSIDPARFGDDATVITLRQGQKVHYQLSLQGFDGFDIASRVVELCRKDTPIACIVYDAIGNGAELDGVLKRVPQLNIQLLPIMWGCPAKDDKQFMNMRSEAWGRMREWLGTGSIPDNDELAEQLSSLDFGYDGRMRIQLESKSSMKKNGGKSPDRADSLALSMCVDLIDRKTTTAKVRPVQRRTVVWSNNR